MFEKHLTKMQERSTKRSLAARISVYAVMAVLWMGVFGLSANALTTVIPVTNNVTTGSACGLNYNSNSVKYWNADIASSGVTMFHTTIEMKHSQLILGINSKDSGQILTSSASNYRMYLQVNNQSGTAKYTSEVPTSGIKSTVAKVPHVSDTKYTIIVGT